MLQVLTERNFPIDNLYPLASEKSVGQTVKCQGQEYTVTGLAEFNFSKVELALFSAGGAISAEYAPLAAEKNCVVIDNTSHFRLDSEVPLIVPEVNAQAISAYKARYIIANPNCSTIQMVVALKPIYDAVGIERINVCTYQAVSGAGAKGVLELENQLHAKLNDLEIKPTVFSKSIAGNVLPHIDVFLENDYTKEEMKIVRETQKIFEDPEIRINPTSVRVPVYYGHSEAVHIETRQKLSKQDALNLLAQAEGVKLFSDNRAYPTALDAAGQDAVLVGRVREDVSHPRGLNLWVVADNVRKGAATNAVQIAELLIKIR